MTTPPAKAGGFSGDGNCLAVSACWLRPSQCPRQDVAGSVDVPVQDQAAVRTTVHTLRELLGNVGPATAARLAGPARIDLHHCNTGSFGLVFQGCHEAAPGSVGNRPAQPAVLDHPLDVQALHRDEAVATAQIQSCLVSVVMTKVLNLGVKPAQTLHSFLVVLAVLLLAADCPAGTVQGWQFGLEIPRVGLVLPVRGGQEALQADINPNRWVGAWGDSNFTLVTDQDNIPLLALAFERGGLNRSFDRTMNLALNHANVLHSELAGWHETNAVAVGRELHGPEAPLGLEARVAGLLAAFNVSEKCCEGPVKPYNSSNATSVVDVCEPPINLALVCEPRCLLNIIKADAILFVSQLALFETGVVEPAVGLEHDVKLTHLIAVGVESELVGAVHDLQTTLDGKMFKESFGETKGGGQIFPCRLKPAVPGLSGF